MGLHNSEIPSSKEFVFVSELCSDIVCTTAPSLESAVLIWLCTYISARSIDKCRRADGSLECRWSINNSCRALPGVILHQALIVGCWVIMFRVSLSPWVCASKLQNDSGECI